MYKYCPLCSGALSPRVVGVKPRLACPDCGYVYYQNPKVAVAVVVTRDGKILLNRRDIDPGRGKWSFPSGYVDVGETVEEAAIRETSEETGLDIRLDRLVGVYSERDLSVVLVVFAARVAGGILNVGEETQDVRFVDPDNLPDLAFPHDQQILRDALL